MRHLFDLWGESCKKVKWPHTLYKFSCKVLLSFSEWFWRYRWNELSVTYLHTNILHTDQPSHWISICWLETWPIGMAIPVKKLQNWRVYNVHYYYYLFFAFNIETIWASRLHSWMTIIYNEWHQKQLKQFKISLSMNAYWVIPGSGRYTRDDRKMLNLKNLQ